MNGNKLTIIDINYELSNNYTLLSANTITIREFISRYRCICAYIRVCNSVLSRCIPRGIR